MIDLLLIFACGNDEYAGLTFLALWLLALLLTAFIREMDVNEDHWLTAVLCWTSAAVLVGLLAVILELVARVHDCVHQRAHSK